MLGIDPEIKERFPDLMIPHKEIPNVKVRKDVPSLEEFKEQIILNRKRH